MNQPGNFTSVARLGLLILALLGLIAGVVQAQPCDCGPCACGPGAGCGLGGCLLCRRCGSDPCQCEPTCDPCGQSPHSIRRPTFSIPRARPWDPLHCKFFGGGVFENCEECGCGHGPHRKGVWDCSHYVVPLPRPNWTVTADGFFVRRVNEDAVPIILDNMGDPFFTADDYRFQYEPGFRVAGQMHLANCRSIEVRYQRVQEWFEIFEVDDGANNLEFNAAGINIVTANPFITSYESRFQSGEVNLHHEMCCGRVSIFGGVRWLEIREELRLMEDGAANELVVDTHNRLFGGQLGVRGSHWVNYGILKIEGSLRGGVYMNSGRTNASFGAAAAQSEDQHPVWVGEAAAAGNFPITRHLWVRAGYEAISVAGVATALEQLSTTDLSVPAMGVNNNGDIIYHGWFLGLHAWW